MEMTLLSPNHIKLLVIDTKTAMIWTDRYNKCGDFELHFSTKSNIYSYIDKKYYLSFDMSEHRMIVESILISSNAESGDNVKVSGRSLESLLERRIVWGQRDITGTPHAIIKTLINEAIINPVNTDRRISNFIFEDSTDPAILGLSSVSLQLFGNNLYSIICDICKAFGIGFKITFNSSNQFVFKLYIGVDRSQAQFINPYVTFSSENDNIISSQYLTTIVNQRTVSLVGGEGEGASRKMVSCGSGSGIDRREIFTDAGDISSQVDGATLTAEEYNSRLTERGNTDLAQCNEEEMFSGQADATRSYIYGIDFSMGDIVQTADNYGHSGRSMITEFIISSGQSGLMMYPTFEDI